MSRPLLQPAVLDRNDAGSAVREPPDPAVLLAMSALARSAVVPPAREPRAREPEPAAPCVRGAAAARHTALRQRMRNLARAAHRLGCGA